MPSKLIKIKIYDDTLFQKECAGGDMAGGGWEGGAIDRTLSGVRTPGSAVFFQFFGVRKFSGFYRSVMFLFLYFFGLQ